ncbi:MAG: asparagine synthetase B [Acidobacteria bacterium]|nr:MAG: asparagine synthetase B [Acidobacteriota bacterium]REK01477.1 MAG: asparagine synthetase B [Acidobacteriota bacterium]REK14433.1 MAG: asparagine synthetase B [Acidobacteriota bacterium]REK45148.1 MAG: asparagine synthetase B [Acidobacteriota bacterium]
MSAIAAICFLDQRPVAPEHIGRMLKALEHRGGDDNGIEVSDWTGLGHQMLRVTPESARESLPRKDTESENVITCDARLDNRDELIDRLGLRDRPKEDVTDSEIILEAYKRWGADCPAELLGDFVFAIWDGRKKTLFAARDALGIKHFYYYFRAGEIFVLASEVKALLAVEGVPCELNELQLGDYLFANSEDKEATFYKGIKRLPATSALTVSASGLKTREYWSPKCDELRLKNDGEYREAFRELFKQAVTSRLRSSYPVGSMLSGGLDSSSISCIASRALEEQGKGPLETFSAVFPTVAKVDPRIDERKYIDSVVKEIACRPNFVEADAVSPFVDIDSLQWHTDDPVGIPMYMDWEILKAARAKNVRTLLSGFDGDSTVSHGYEDLANFALQGRFLKLTRESMELRRNMPRAGHSLKRLIWQNGIAKVIPDPVYSAWRRIRGRGDVKASKAIQFPLHARSVNRKFSTENSLEERVSELRALNYPNDISPSEHHWRALRSGHFARVLENLEKASGAFGVEMRFPFFDRKLIEFCIALPPGQRINKGWTRSILRYGMEGIIPDEIRFRTDKSNIGASVKINMLKHGQKLLKQTVWDDSTRLEKFLDLDVLRKAYDDYVADPIKHESEALLMMTSVYLVNWYCQSGFDKRPEGSRSKTPGAPVALKMA